MVVRSLSHPHDVALGVADGVGSWSQNGVDPALFSQALMYHASQAFERAKEGARDEDARPVRLLSKAYGEVMQEKGVPAGSSTATILTLESETGVLRSANLGDSGFMVLREDAMAGNPGGEGAAGAVDQGDDLGRGRGVPGKRPLPGTLYRSAPQQWVSRRRMTRGKRPLLWISRADFALSLPPPAHPPGLQRPQPTQQIPSLHARRNETGQRRP